MKYNHEVDDKKYTFNSKELLIHTSPMIRKLDIKIKF